MEGRIQKAREGRWNGGFAPYGYRLVDGVLQINEDEAPAIRTIFEQYVNTDTGANGLSKYLETHGFQKLARQNGTSPLFSATLIRAFQDLLSACGLPFDTLLPVYVVVSYSGSSMHHHPL